MEVVKTVIYEKTSDFTVRRLRDSKGSPLGAFGSFYHAKRNSSSTDDEILLVFCILLSEQKKFATAVANIKSGCLHSRLSLLKKYIFLFSGDEPPTRVRPLFSPIRAGNSPTPAFCERDVYFTVCGQRQGLFALDLSRFL